ncbi:MAG: FAD-dependent oxidoreductase [Bacteroidota bacterium]
MHSSLYELKAQAEKENLHFEVILQGDTRYEESRVIANSRFHLYPLGIAYCTQAKDVSFCIQFCVSNKIALRVRSGGHQHEGMCSANEVLIIDLSHIYGGLIDYGPDLTAWIPPGRKLGLVYAELEQKGLTIPGGGCQSVCVGGLTQGGGWGLSTRLRGMTCDNILAAEMVLANGDIIEARADNEYKDLFWAIRGGGGGNFGIITKFHFELTQLAPEMTTFSLRWGKEAMYPIALRWIQMHFEHSIPESLTSACRISATTASTSDGAIIIVGQFYGNRQDALDILAPLYEVAQPIREEFTSHQYPVKKTTPQGFTEASPLATNSPQLAERQGYLGNLLQPAAPIVDTTKAPSQTCDAPHPHKITSSFPKADVDLEAMVHTIIDFLNQTQATSHANQYLSIHGMGGKVMAKSPTDTAFYYRNKAIMLQIQAWWANTGEANFDYQKDQHLIQWVAQFRQALYPFTEGAFINFPDKDLVKDYHTPEGRRILLHYYYSDNLPRLIDIKTKYDAHNLFHFGMSIPLKE